MQLDNVAKLLDELREVAEQYQREAMTLTNEADLIHSAVITYGSIQSLKVIEQEVDEWNLYAQARQLRLNMEDALSILDPRLQATKGELPAWWVIPAGGYMPAQEAEGFEFDDDGTLTFIGHISNIDVHPNELHEFKDACFQYVADSLTVDMRDYDWSFVRLTVDKARGVFIVFLKGKP